MRNLKIFSSLYNGSIGFYGRQLCVTADNEEIKALIQQDFYYSL